MTFFHLEFRDAIAQQPADAIRTLEHRDVVSGTRELLRRREPRRAAPNDSDALARLFRSNDGRDPAFFKRTIDDFNFDLFDRDGRLVNAQDARTFTWCRAQTPCELWEVVRRV